MSAVALKMLFQIQNITLLTKVLLELSLPDSILLVKIICLFHKISSIILQINCSI